MSSAKSSAGSTNTPRLWRRQSSASPMTTAGVRIVAYLAARAEQRPSIIEMKSFCAGHLPAYMSPDVFRFLDALPRTSTDKIDYQSLARLADGVGPQLTR